MGPAILGCEPPFQAGLLGRPENFWIIFLLPMNGPPPTTFASSGGDRAAGLRHISPARQPSAASGVSSGTAHHGDGFRCPLDRLLDAGKSGSLFLARPEIAQVVTDALQHGHVRFQRYELHAFVIMPNHVHLLTTPRVSARRWLGPLKGFTAHEANRMLGRCGEPFWQDESYDHVVKSGEEFRRIRAYIENNPVKAGLAQTPYSFRWSSAYKEPPGQGGCSHEWLTPHKPI